MSDRLLAPLALAGATLAVSISAILTQEARTDAATVVWLRMALAVVLLSGWLVARRGRAQPAPRRRDVVVTLGAGSCLAVHFLSWTASLAFTSVAASVLLVSLHPLIVAPLGRRLYGDSIHRWMAAGITLALAGTAVTCLGALRGGGDALRGDALALLGAVALAAYLLIGRSRPLNASVAGYSAAVYAVVCLAGVVAGLAQRSLHAPSGRALLACAGLAVVCTIAGHTVFNWTLRRLSAATVSLAFLGEPPLAALAALVVLGQRPALATVAGGALILTGLGVALRHHADRGEAAPVALP